MQRALTVAGDERQLVVLLAEDDPGDALLTEELISDGQLPATVHWVRSATEAREVLSGGGIDCLVLDLHLPDLDGIGELAQVMRTFGSTAVVVLTGLDDRAAGLAAVRAGAQDYLVKGQVQPEWFVRSIRYAVQRKHVETTASALQAAQLRAEENARLERGLLPSPLLAAAELKVTARYQPGRAAALLGGDFYDVVESPDGTVHAVIGDVSGHGPDEAALGVCLRVAWRTLVMTGHHGPRLVAQLERLLLAERRGPEIFATLAMVAWPPGGGPVRVVRAGHPGLLLRSASKVRLVEPEHGPALGLLPPGLAVWPETELIVGPDESAVLFTDGLFEATVGPRGERLGEDRLVQLAQELAGLPADGFVDALISATRSRTVSGFADDVAVVQLERTTVDHR